MLDSSVFVSALRSAEGASRRVLRLCLEQAVEPLMGQKLFSEYSDVMGRPGLFARSPLSEQERHAVFEGLLSVCRWTQVFYLWRPNLPDEGDNHLIELAVAGGAESVVTFNRRDFRGELHFSGLRIVTPAQFLSKMR